jgi:hypothetical protein
VRFFRFGRTLTRLAALRFARHPLPGAAQKRLGEGRRYHPFFLMTPSARRNLILAVLGAVVFRYACFVVMTILAVWNETRPSARVPDLIIDNLPPREAPAIHLLYSYNLVLWFLAYVPGGLMLLAVAPYRFLRYMVSCGLVSLLRGACLTLTSLGPIGAEDAHTGLGPDWQLRAVLQIINPLGVIARREPESEFLLKDLFFSGHVASTFLLLLYVWPIVRLR